MALDFSNRTFNPAILQQFRAAYEAYASRQSEERAKVYAEFFRYHCILDTDMAPHASHFSGYVDEIVRQIGSRGELVRSCGGAWLYLKDLPEDLLDSGNRTLEAKAKELAEAVQRQTGDKLLPAWYKDLDSLEVPTDGVPKELKELFARMFALSVAVQQPGRFREAMSSFQDALRGAEESRVRALAILMLQRCEKDPDFRHGLGLKALLEACGPGLGPQILPILKHKASEMREAALRYLCRHKEPGAVSALVALHARERVGSRKRLIAEALAFQGAEGDPEAQAILAQKEKPQGPGAKVKSAGAPAPAASSKTDPLQRVVEWLRRLFRSS
ncbi:MAG: HEAT repeat domain-containing protein [Candidatus Wallbacteria bacterium]|nr:HEAT repeat domain-containing protein [Candidatus Wallbacteria bacterium]